MSTAELLRRTRERSGLTLRGLAESADTSAATLSAYETGRKRPRVDVYARILAVQGAQLTIEPVAHSRADRLARLLAREAADRLERDPSLIDDARDALSSSPSVYATAWRHVLDAGVGVTLAVLRSADERTQPMLTDSPFLGLLDDTVRLELVRRAHRP